MLKYQYLKKILSIALLIVLLQNVGFGQKLDSFVQAQFDSSYHYSRYDLSKCLAFIDSALLLNERSFNDTYPVDISSYYLGICYNRHGEYEDALKYFDQGIRRFKRRKDTVVLADLFYQKSLVYRQQSDYINFTKNINTSQDLAELVGYQSIVGMCNNAKLIHYKERLKFEEAEKAGMKALDIFISIRDSSSQGDVYNNLGVLMTGQGKFDKALEFHLKQHELNVKLNNVWGKGYSHSKLAAAFGRKNEFKLAEYHMGESIKITESIGTPYEMAGALHRRARLYLKMGKFKNALNDAHISKSIALKYDQKNTYTDIFETLTEIHQKQNKLDSALYYSKKFIAVKDSVLNASIGKQLSEFEVKYETEKKEAEISKLALESELDQSRISRQRIIIFSSLMGLGLLLFLLMGLRSKNLKINEQNNVISKALKEKDILLKEIHHRVKNNLQVISSLLSIQSRAINDTKAKDALKEGRSRVQSMSLIHQNLYQKDNLTGIEMDDYLPRLSQTLFDTYNISGDRIGLKTDIESIKLEVETVIPIGLIVNELITNSLKYAFPDDMKGEITVILKETNNTLELSVMDTGIGIDQSQLELNENSFGHSLIKAFKNKLKAEIVIDGSNGTKIDLLIHNYKKLT